MMNNRLIQFAKKMKLFPGVSGELLRNVELSLNRSLPKDYTEFMAYSNGAVGPIGANSYLVLWPVDELHQINKDYGVDEFAPGLFLFGSDGAGMGYAFDSRTEPLSIVEIPFVGMSLSEVRLIGHTFVSFLESLEAI